MTRPADIDARTLLRDVGVRATDQRIAVFDALRDVHSDATAQELHAHMAKAGTELGLATVYRALGVLVDAGLVDALQHGASTCYRACAPGHHHHLTCDSCHAVIELHDCGVEEWADRIARRHGYTDVHHVVELHGTCSDCRAA
ncbi:MAG: transcriptional repressor [Thermoleophilia bacterium]|nr:transcriptional repressor [Thermoleophilia bacterium]